MEIWLAVCLVTSLGVAAALLAVPLELRLRLAASDRIEGRLRVEWLFGRVGRDIEPTRGRGAPPKWPGRERLALLWQEPFRAEAARLLRRWRRWFSIAELTGRARVGLGDPADTGMAMGWIQPALGALRALPHVDLRVEPDFECAVLRGELRAAASVPPFGLLAPLVAFALSPTTIRTVWRLRSPRS